MPYYPPATSSSTTPGVFARNFLINSAFDFWQTGTSVTIANAASTYQPDQWYGRNVLGTNGVLTLSRVTGVTDGSRYGAQLQITTAPTAAQVNGCELYQTLENQQTLYLYNQTASFTVLVKALNNVNQVGVQFFYKTTEAKVDTAIGAEQTATVNSSTFTAISINGQALGTSMTTSGVIGVRIRITAVSTGNTYDINNGFVCEQANLTLGSTAPTSFARAGITPQQELALCQRFYEKSFPIATTPVTNTTAYTTCIGSYTGTSAVSCNSIFFKVQKRVSPTMTAYDSGSANTGAWSFVNNSGSVNTNVSVSLGSSEFEFVPSSNAVATGVVAQSTRVQGNWVADARI